MQFNIKVHTNLDPDLWRKTGSFVAPENHVDVTISSLEELEAIVNRSRDVDVGLNFSLWTTFEEWDLNDVKWYLVFPRSSVVLSPDTLESYNDNYYYYELAPEDKGGYAPIKLGREYRLGKVRFNKSGVAGVNEGNFEILVSPEAKLLIESVGNGLGFHPLFHYKNRLEIVAYLLMTEVFFPPLARDTRLLTGGTDPVMIDCPIVDACITDFKYDVARTRDPVELKGGHAPGWVFSRTTLESVPGWILKGLRTKPVISQGNHIYDEYVESISRISESVRSANSRNRI